MIAVFFTKFIQPLSKVKMFFLTKTLPPKIIDDISKFNRWQDRHSCLFGKLLLKRALTEINSRASLENLQYTPYKRPYINDTVDFNISHSGEYVVCVISTSNKVGVDIEKIIPIDVSEFSSQLTLSERNAIDVSPDPTAQFFQYWTKKEAILKANGKGLGLEMNQFDVTGETVALENVNWYLSRLTIDQKYACYLATENKVIEQVTFTKVDFYD